MSILVEIVDGQLPPHAAPWCPSGAGAVIAFEGIVRPTEADQAIMGLRYETYEPMAQKQLQRLAAEALRQFGLAGIRIWHSRGLVSAGACSFRLMVAAAHRKEALAAMDWFIDALKKDVPIWKHAVAAQETAQQAGPLTAMPSATGNKTGHGSPDAALDALLPELALVGTECVDLSASAGRVLAAPVLADRDSPACDVSAMDGYAVRLADLRGEAVAVAGEASIGQPIASLPRGQAMRIFTGGPVPLGAEAVIRREDVEESPRMIRLRVPPQSITIGQEIRRRGENIAAGQVLADGGTTITPALAAAMAAFGVARPSVYRRLRVGVLATGNELLGVGDAVESWQIRDSNGPGLAAMLARTRWIDPPTCQRMGDDRGAIASALKRMLGECDAVLLTGGVSMGDYDHVPDAIGDAGGRIIFHRLPIRPGKPILGAVAPRGKLILGLPGNPVSVLVTARRLAIPALMRLAGLSRTMPADAMVRIANPDHRPLKLHWFRLVRRLEAGVVELLANKGSGDVAGAARAHGFVEVPPGMTSEGPFAYYQWTFS